MNTFRYVLLWILVVVAALAQGETRQEVMDRIQARPGVVANGVQIVQYGTFMNGAFGEVYYSTIMWLVKDEAAGTVRKETGDLIVIKQGVVGEERVEGWLGEVPRILRETAPPEEDPLGTDEEIVGALGVKVLKAQVERGASGEARVTGYEVVDGEAVPAAWLVHMENGARVVVKEKVAVAVATEKEVVAR